MQHNGIEEHATYCLIVHRRETLARSLKSRLPAMPNYKTTAFRQSLALLTPTYELGTHVRQAYYSANPSNDVKLIVALAEACIKLGPMPLHWRL